MTYCHQIVSPPQKAWVQKNVRDQDIVLDQKGKFMPLLDGNREPLSTNRFHGLSLVVGLGGQRLKTLLPC